MTFSGALSITDLDDYLNPSQACIVPVKQTNKVLGQDQGVSADTEIRIDSANNYYEVSSGSSTLDKPATRALDGGLVQAGPSSVAQPLQKAEISLEDCLACSGCVTSAESILITAQSHLEVQDYMTTNPPANVPGHRDGIISISPQTLASLSASYPTSHGRHIPSRTLLRRIRHFLARSENGAWSGVWDTTFARHLSLIEHVKEFRERQVRAKDKGKAKVGGGGAAAAVGDSSLQDLPMLASACPGWICYVEKSCGHLLGLVSETRSPQAVMGALAKQWWAARHQRSPQEIYHVSVMPCYDKKLEASRSDFYSDVHHTRDVDCVLTTGELDLLLRDRGFDPRSAVPGEDDQDIDASSSPFPEMLEHPGTSSGSYLHSLIYAIQRESPHPTRLHVRPIRGEDHTEYTLEDLETGEIVFKGVKCYGRQNMENLVRKVGKTGSKRNPRLLASAANRRRAKVAAAGGLSATTSAENSDSSASTTAAMDGRKDDKTLDYVEVFACPGGCVNGGGQMKPKPKTKEGVSLDEEGFPQVLPLDGVEVAPAPVDEGMRWSTKAWVAEVEQVYWNGLPTPPSTPPPAADDHADVVETWREGRRAEADEVALRILKEVCKPELDVDSPTARMDDPAEDRRRDLMRTGYHKVEKTILASYEF